MIKKILGIALAAIMMFGVFGLAGCDNISLADYKVTGKAAIEAYAQERKDNYCDSNWTVVCGIVEEGNQAIDEAVSKADVDMAVREAKDAIDEVEKEVEIVREKLHDSWWDGKIEVSLDFPRTVEQGASFEVTVTTTNISGDILTYESCYCCSDIGVLITAIVLKADENKGLWNQRFTEHDEGIKESTIQVGASAVGTWSVDTSKSMQGGDGPCDSVVAVGIYDIYLSNGEVFRGAITIV